MSLDSGWKSNAFEPFKEVEFKTADKKAIVYSKIVYGEWIEDGAITKCSVCGNTSDYCGTENFCHNCGADMRSQ